VWCVGVEIFHSWRGDLTIDLTAPNGKTARLQSSTGETPGSDADNLITTWSSDSHSALAGLTGTSGAGVWTLKVVDTSRGDAGTLEYIRIACK
ncbi:MAG: hypothetical protein D3909_08895, partial [Candidatus Electrothrix sp. ATG1]|nr:hypothetical protein [Candidatus Electrothrix sp. ATG1]